MNRHGLTETELSSLQEQLRTPSPDKKVVDENVIIHVPKLTRRRRTTTTNSEDVRFKKVS